MRGRAIYTRALLDATSRQLARRRPPRPYLPAGSLGAAVSALGDLGDASTGTGIDFIDQNLTAIRNQVDEAALAAKVTAAAAIIGGLASVLLIFRTGGGGAWFR
jgi:hypothetical protein